jgi:ATP-dependent helicase YprA (DUF1998 family)
MDVFQLRDQLTQDYAEYVQSFVHIHDTRIKGFVDKKLKQGAFWPDPLIQLNPNFKSGAYVHELVDEGVLHPECDNVFLKSKDQHAGTPLRLYQHQIDAIRTAHSGHNYVLTTGTGSGKSLAYIVPIVDHVLRQGSGRGVQAIIVYPMNALANSQFGELEKFLKHGYPNNRSPVTFAKYTGQESETQRQEIIANPPDIILTNYVMLELMMTRPRERGLIRAAQGLSFLVLDELHTYRGRQGADVALLVRRVRDRLTSGQLQCVGTSATLASEGTFEEQRAQVAQVATQLFGAPVGADQVIGETLQRATQPYQSDDRAFFEELAQVVAQGQAVNPPQEYIEFIGHVFSRWIENIFGVTVQSETGRLQRSTPRSIKGKDGAAELLCQQTGIDGVQCAKAIAHWLMAGTTCKANPETGFSPFAFRLHQFVSPGNTVFASLESESNRYLTLSGQQYVPGSNREKLLFPLCFCRECGQEFYNVRLSDNDGQKQIASRDFGDRLDDNETEAGYLYLSTKKPWPLDNDKVLERLPDDWLEDHRGGQRIRRHRRKHLPREMWLATNGRPADEESGQFCVFLPTPFMFCPNCGVAYSARQGDFGKLVSLNVEGRSSATTILSLSAILALKEDEILPQTARKLLSFTDNRQDASLQAGHFNDFIEIGLLRGAIYRAAVAAGEGGMRHETIAQRVFDALNLPVELYASDPGVRFQALQETQRALRQVLGYRIYRDLRRGWRVTLPNLEQCGLLEIDYLSLPDVCTADDVWQDCHPALALADSETRQKIAKVLLDYMRRELAIKVDYLDGQFQEQIRQLGSQRLIDPWAIDENERLEYASVLYPRSSGGDDNQQNTYVSSRGGFGLYLRRNSTFADYDVAVHGKIGLPETEILIKQLLEGLRVAGLVEIVQEPKDENDVPGYQLVAAAMRWRAGEGTRSFHDPIRVPQSSVAGGRANPFFIRFYRELATVIVGLNAREHTAQVPYDKREEREERFREGRLPILYCSPTMELGVDIAELNVVNMRNVPPTPANYAQRSGRAGRSGQPALVFTYCSGGSPHDQYFFKRPEQMVAGAVAPPRLDLTNQDLIRAHIHAIWLAETEVNLGRTLKEILDVDGENPSLNLLPGIRQDISSERARHQAHQRAQHVMQMIDDGLNDAPWYTDEWLSTVFRGVEVAFDATCNRWRELYRAARIQAEVQGRIVRDASRTARDRRQADRLRREAESQLNLLTEIDRLAQSDFYSYRYFATEGFLPGYSFPRLPISAFIPARRVRQRDEFLSRPRFLAVSEFGPRAIIYHEGSRYLIHQVILPVQEGDGEPLTEQVKQCPACGYLHPLQGDVDYDLCQRCNADLDVPLKSLLRMQNVVTKRRDRISSDEEERFRLGYEIRTGVRYAEVNGRPDFENALVIHDEQQIARLEYAQAATLWRINMGWARRKNREQHGFVLDIERGYWARNEQIEEDSSDPMSERVRRVIPYVEDTRNCLLLESLIEMEDEELISLQYALKRAIEAIYQLEGNELACEILGEEGSRVLLFYEAAEGGAGVLRRLVDEPRALSIVARKALEICHFDPNTGDDMRRAPRATEDCEAACYDCLLSYSNQRMHPQLDRQLIRNTLIALTEADIQSSPTSANRDDHGQRLLNLCDSDLERDWIAFLEANGYRLPDDGQILFEDCNTRPDFVYRDSYTVVYVDGSHHDYPNRQARDAQQADCMEDEGYTVIRFGYRDDWQEIVARYPHVFGGEA